MWSGRPNGRLVADVADLVPGRALDADCGEGADAIWLARRGWTVTADDLDGVHREHMKSRAVDPVDYVGADDLLPLLDDDFAIERHALVTPICA